MPVAFAIHYCYLKITTCLILGSIMSKTFAEFFGTFWLVFGGCGSAIFAASVNLGIGYVGVAFAFGFNRINHGLRCRSHFWWSL